MFPPEIEREREAMYQARAAGNEGRARVCARRAAGQALRLRYRAMGVPGNAYDWLVWASREPEVPEAVSRGEARCMRPRVTERSGMGYLSEIVEEYGHGARRGTAGITRYPPKAVLGPEKGRKSPKSDRNRPIFVRFRFTLVRWGRMVYG